MKHLSISIVILAVIFSVSCSSKSNKQNKENQDSEITFVEDNTDKRIDV